MNAHAPIQPRGRQQPGLFEVKPTPGPWRAPSAGIYGPDDLLICSLGHEDTVRAYRARGDTCGELLMANARLIAAAPELVAAIVALLPFVDGKKPGALDVCMAVHAVLTKAIG